jgi:hypothetical protein
MPWILFWIKKGWPEKEITGHLTSEEYGSPNFKGRMMVNPSSIGTVIFLCLK